MSYPYFPEPSGDKECRDLKDKKLADKFMYIPNDGTQNYLICRLQLVVEETFGHSTQWTNQSKFGKKKVDKPTNKNTLL